jgi:hypothetical protein
MAATAQVVFLCRVLNRLESLVEAATTQENCKTL